MNIDIGTIKNGQESIGNCSIGKGAWRRLYVNAHEASEVRHLLVDLRTMQQDHFECMLDELVRMETLDRI